MAKVTSSGLLERTGSRHPTPDRAGFASPGALEWRR